MYGEVRFADGTPVHGACITTAPTSTSSCITKSVNGAWSFTKDIKPGQTITLYAIVEDLSRGGIFKGAATATLTAPSTNFGVMNLTR